MYNYVTDSVKLHNTLMVLMEISLILELWILFSRIMREEKLKKMVSIGVLFFSSFCVMCVFLNDHRYQIGDNDHPSCMIDVPVWTLFAGMFLLLILLCLLIRKEIIVCRKSISFWSVKETIDNTKLSEESSVFYLSDNTVWMFQEYMLSESELEGYIQTVAFDISEIYYNSEKIRMNNEKLEVLNKKLKKMYDQIDDSIREQETLKMKMQVHDSFGRSLLTIRRMLESHKETDHMENQLEILKQSVYILSGITQDDPDKQYQETIRHAQKLGVSVEIEGEICEEAKVALITDKAIRECVTNCIRHAHGSKVYVQSYKILEGWKIRITNDGENPKEGSKEGGGLSALREAVEREGGQMITRFAPRFLLVLELPLGGTED